MAATQLFINVAASAISRALVRSVTDMTPVAFPELVIGDGRSYELYFVDGQGGYAAFSGDGSYIPYIAIGACGFPSGGTAIWTFNGYSTAALAYDVSPAALQTALQALTSIGSGNVTVAGVAGKYYVITFTGTLGHLPQPEVTVNFDGLTPASTVDISTIVVGAASPAANAVQLATLAQNPITFADDWAPITNGWTGSLSARTLEIFEAFAIAGGTLTETFQVTVANADGIRTTYAKVSASIQCTIISPESFAGADKPLLATQAALNAAVLGLNNFTREALSSAAAGNTNVTRPATSSRHHLARVSLTGAAGIRTISLLTTNSPNPGDVILLAVLPDATAGNEVKVYNATTGGTLLADFTTAADSQPYFLVFSWNGSAWELDLDDSILLSKSGNLAGLANTVTAKANLKALFANISDKSVNFTVTEDDEGTLFRVSTAGGPVTVTLPLPGDVDAGFLIAIQKYDAAAQNVITSPATRTLTDAGEIAVIQSDGSAWTVVIAFDPAVEPPLLIETVENRQDITGLQGETSTDLDGIATAAGATTVGSALFITARGGGIWVLRTGTDAESLTIVRPFDFDAVTNAVVWELRLGGFTQTDFALATLDSGDVTPTPAAPLETLVYTVGGAARTSKITLQALGADQAGWLVNLRLAMPATAAIVIEIWDAAGIAAIYSVSSDDGGGSAFNAFLSLYWDGTAWKPLSNIVPVV